MTRILLTIKGCMTQNFRRLSKFSCVNLLSASQLLQTQLSQIFLSPQITQILQMISCKWICLYTDFFLIFQMRKPNRALRTFSSPVGQLAKSKCEAKSV